jgi:hypothetical protein
MVTNLLSTFGSPTIKSIEMLIHICVGINSSYNAPSIFIVSPFWESRRRKPRDKSAKEKLHMEERKVVSSFSGVNA